MNRILLLVLTVVVYFAIVHGENSLQSEKSQVLQRSHNTDLQFEARTRKHHHHHKLWYLWGWHALAIAYWVKVKLIVVGFFVGSAIFVALRYAWPHKCSTGIVHDSPSIVYDHPPPAFANDHVPYSLDHSPHFDQSFSNSDTVDPYSAYAGSYSEDITATAEVVSPTAPNTHRVGRRSVSHATKVKRRQQQPESLWKTEDRIAELMFDFLGLDSMACRRRFICEMEFRSRLNPLSGMAFRILGRGLFEKYMNVRNKLGRAQSFAECTTVNPQCKFIEQNNSEPVSTEILASDNQSSGGTDATTHINNEIIDSLEENQTSFNKPNINLEIQNEGNLQAERRYIAYLRHSNLDSSTNIEMRRKLK
ncbi:uncharacterized protein LOC105221454 [Zeugodacus cucurbitae]|uniref:uncharacterized protein LOC105221454 n=1 Tax=Zeugodacus cucurbitae TaxID=28588 RepID=UPI00059688FF|nr:uncharacterized protein LOC105221454 [Zeugodacus cucurbitae]